MKDPPSPAAATLERWLLATAAGVLVFWTVNDLVRLAWMALTALAVLARASWLASLLLTLLPLTTVLMVVAVAVAVQRDALPAERIVAFGRRCARRPLATLAALAAVWGANAALSDVAFRYVFLPRGDGAPLTQFTFGLPGPVLAYGSLLLLLAALGGFALWLLRRRARSHRAGTDP